MTAPYRDELAALEARYAALEAEVEDRERARDEAARMLAEAKARVRQAEIAADVRSGGPARRRQQALLVLAGVVGTVAILIGAVYLANRKPSVAERMAEMVDQFDTFTKQLCACKDNACANIVQDRIRRWSDEMVLDPDLKDMRPSRAMMNRINELTDRYAKCFQQVVLPPAAPAN